MTSGGFSVMESVVQGGVAEIALSRAKQRKGRRMDTAKIVLRPVATRNGSPDQYHPAAAIHYGDWILKKFSLPLLLLLFLLAGAPLGAQQTRSRVYANFIKEPITIDGALEEPEWQEAPDNGDLIHIPYEGEDYFYEQTSIKLLYDRDHLYVAFICRDSQAATIQSNVDQRDADLRFDDSVYILLSIDSDTRNYYFFGTNPLGTQADAQVSKSGEIFNPLWNGNWQAAAKFLNDGWSAEISINLDSLGQLGETKTVGMGFSRLVPRLATSFWRGPLDPVFNFGNLQELQPIPLAMLAKKISVNPHVLLASGETGFAGGATASYTFSQKASASMTVLPDFITVEEDPEYINLTRFELRYPEKREFFAAAAAFDSDIPIFYSKRIKNVTTALNFEASAGSFDINAMTALEKQGESVENSSANFSVLQIQRQTESWSLRAMASNRFVKGVNQGAVGFDGLIRISDNITVDGEFFASYGQESRQNLAFSLRPSYDNENFHFHIAFRELGEYFGDNVNVIGFIQDDNRREVDTGLVKVFPFSKGALKVIRLSSSFNIFWGTDGVLRSWVVEQGFLLQSRNKFSIGIDHQEEYKVYEKEFRNRLTRFSIGFNLMEQWQRVGMAISAGSSFNREFNLFELFKRFKISQGFFLEYDLGVINFDEADWMLPDARDTWIHMLRAHLEMSSRLTANIHFTFHSLRHLQQRGERKDIKRNSLLLQVTWLALPPKGIVQIGYKSLNTEFGLPRLLPDEGTAYVRISYAF
jgi:hypothetical protein